MLLLEFLAKSIKEEFSFSLFLSARTTMLSGERMLGAEATIINRTLGFKQQRRFNNSRGNNTASVTTKVARVAYHNDDLGETMATWSSDVGRDTDRARGDTVVLSFTCATSKVLARRGSLRRAQQRSHSRTSGDKGRLWSNVDRWRDRGGVGERRRRLHFFG
ncbi:unnamed protein product, partial [Microthlaspi erraticum]